MPFFNPGQKTESVIPVETYLNRRMLQWYGDERGSECHACGDIPQ